FHVTGVQTCALPISGHQSLAPHAGGAMLNTRSPIQAERYTKCTARMTRVSFAGRLLAAPAGGALRHPSAARPEPDDVQRWELPRSEERRVGKAGRAR